MSVNRNAEIKFHSQDGAHTLITLGFYKSQAPGAVVGWTLRAARPVFPVTRLAVLRAKNGTAWAVGTTENGYRYAWKTVEISLKLREESYRLRSVPGGYKGDRVKRWSRYVNGRKIDFVRIAWNQSADGVTVRAEDAETAKIIHEFHYAPKGK